MKWTSRFGLQLNGSFRCYHGSAQGNRLHRMSEYLLSSTKQSIRKDDTSSFKLLKGYGFIDSLVPGLNVLLPWCTRAISKLVNIIDQEMESIGAKRAIFPNLAPVDFLKKSDKWDTLHKDVFHMHDRAGQELYLTPTHEEVICHWISKEDIFEKSLPLYLYQIGSKFRDEKRARSGLLRSKEFIMKDLYTFDKSQEEAMDSYEKVNQCYQRIFERLDLPIFKVKADSGNIGGDCSHEYHLVSVHGEDKIYVCDSCRDGYSEEYVNKFKPNIKRCGNCNNLMEEKLSLELGHSFFLGTRYTKPFSCSYKQKDKESLTLQMGCYGLGVSRIVGASLEAHPSDRLITWPEAIAPFTICFIMPKTGSKEESIVTPFARDTALFLHQSLGFDLVIDDREKLTIGRKLVDSKVWGFPYIIVAGKKAAQNIPIFELFINRSGSHQYLNHSQLIDFFTRKVTSFKSTGGFLDDL